MADELKASPENKYLAELSKALEWLAHPKIDGQEIKSRGPMITDLLPLESASKFIGRLARHEPLTTGAGGIGGTTRLQPDVADFALDFAPFAGDAAKLTTKGAKGVARMAGEELNKRFLSGQMFPGGAPTANFVIKPKGGNWQSTGIDLGLSKLKIDLTPTNYEQVVQRYGEDRAKQMLKEHQQSPFYKDSSALNQWVEKNLTNYVKKEMGTPEDPVRKLAEQGITHLPPNTLVNYSEDVDPLTKSYRKMAGYPEKGMGKSQLAKGWENLVDSNTNVSTAKALTDPKELSKNIGLSLNNAKVAAKLNLLNDPYLSKIDSNTPVYSNKMLDRFGFDHIMDVLKEDMANGRLRPESLKNVSMEQAVRRTYEYDQEMAKKMAEAQIKATEHMPTVKEYPTGHKWIELKIPDYNALPLEERKQIIAKLTEEAKQKGLNPQDYISNYPQNQLSEALKYEGETMGHCVGGYCPDVVAGRSRIFSLRDAKGEPHVTIELEPGRLDADTWMKTLTPEERREILSTEGSVIDHPRYLQERGNAPPNIVQIKGKQNLAPKEQYLPFVQDFVKSGNWGRVGDLRNTGLVDLNRWESSESNDKLKDHAQSLGLNLPRYLTKKEYGDLENHFLLNELSPEHQNEFGIPKVDLPASLQAYKTQPEVPTAPEVPPTTGMKRGGKVRLSNNPDVMQAEIMQRGFAGGGSIPKMLERAAPKAIEEIRAIAERMAPQVIGEDFIRGAQGTESIAGKTQKQFAREKELPIDIRPNKDLPPLSKVDLAKHKGKVMVGIKGDPTVADKTLYSVGDVTLQSPSPQHGGPLYGLGSDAFWASGLGQARRAQNLAKEASMQYDAPVLGNYVMMGPDSYYYAQHFADANLNAIDPYKMTKAQMEALNKAIRRGGPLSGGPRPSFPGIDDVGDAYLQLQMDPKLRKHFNQLMMKANTSKMYGVPSGQDIAYAITEPSLRNLEIGVTGHGMGEMYPDKPLTLSAHPTYSHDIPGNFLGQTEYPIPYELSFPDTTQAIRANPKQGGSQEFSSFGMVGPRQIIDQQLIDELGEYQRQMKALTGKKKGGKVSISNNPNSMLMEIMNKKMAGGGAVTKTLAKMAEEAPEMIPFLKGMFEKGEEGVHEMLKKVMGVPEVKAVKQGDVKVTERIPELQEASQKIGTSLTPEQYAELVEKHLPIRPLNFIPKPPTDEEAMNALNQAKRAKYGNAKDIQQGDIVGARLDIPAYTENNTWVNSIHPKDKPTTYSTVSHIKNFTIPNFDEKALAVAQGGNKSPFAKMEGEWQKITPENAIAMAKELYSHPEWTQVGMDPRRAGYFYDRYTAQPVISGEEALQIGPMVLVKNPKYANKSNFKFAHGGAVSEDDIIMEVNPL
jgi:PcfJ-like protein